MKEIYKYVLDKATLPKESKENLKSLYDKVNQEDNVVSLTTITKQIAMAKPVVTALYLMLMQQKSVGKLLIVINQVARVLR